MRPERSQEENHKINAMAGDVLFSDLGRLSSGTDKIFSYLMLAQWIFGMILAYTVTPNTALGANNPYGMIAIFGGSFVGRHSLFVEYSKGRPIF